MNWLSENIAIVLEVIAVILGIIYVILASRNHIYCWFFGILGSLVSIYIFIEYAQLYAEAMLYSYYVIAGIYGWMVWKKTPDTTVVYQHHLKKHILIGIGGTIVSIGFYFLVSNIFTGAARPLIDSFTTVFSFIATYLTAKKWIGNWIYWIIIDVVTTYLYASRELYVYAVLMAAYSVIAIYGFTSWKKLNIVSVDA